MEPYYHFNTFIGHVLQIAFVHVLWYFRSIVDYILNCMCITVDDLISFFYFELRSRPSLFVFSVLFYSMTRGLIQRRRYYIPCNDYTGRERRKKNVKYR